MTGSPLDRYRAALCGSTLLMIGLSWPLWVDSPDFPRVPFLRGWPAFPAWVSWLVLGGIAASLALAAVGRWWRPMLRAGVGLLAFAFLSDQNRFQPWAYQCALIGLAMAWLPGPTALRMARWFAVGLYLHSGLSKLDASFCRELGPTFLAAALGPIGLDPSGWPAAGCLVMPGFEVAVAILLIFPGTRRVGLAGAVAQHLALVGILGPWGLGHSTIVLVWNGALIVEDVLLFGPSPEPDDSGPWGWSAIVGGAFVVALALPMGERFGLCDAWPGHALYASHAERSEVFLAEGDVDRFPAAVVRRLEPAGVSPWRRLDLTGWSRDVRGTPMYPSGRVGNAVAESFEASYGGSSPVRLVQWGRARAWDGRRDRDEAVGLKAIRRRGDAFLLNAHPAGL